MNKTNSNLEFRKIKSLKYLYEINENGTILRNIKSKKQIKIFLDMHHSKKGYYAAFICRNHIVTRVMIHKLVAECWLGDKPEGLVIDHIDRNTHNNDYRNLRYCTISENMKNRVLGEHIINQAKKNCLNYVMTVLAKKVIIKNEKEELQFDSMTQASKYIGEKVNKPSEHIRGKMKQRRSHIYGYDIIYLNAETRHANSTE